MKKLAVVFGILISVAPIVRADCGAMEKTLFSCLTSKGKLIEVCNLGETIQYSFGRPKSKPEITVLLPTSKVSGESCYTCGRYISNSVYIPNKDTIYIVSWSSDKIDTDVPLQGSVEVIINGKSKATIMCGSEPVVGNSEGIVFMEPAVGN